MTIALNKKITLPKKVKYEVIIIALFTIYTGLFFRFHNLEGKIYWLDESFTSLSVSAYFGKGGQMTMRANYLIPSLLSLQIMFANLLGNKILSKKRIWLRVTVIFFSLSIISSSTMTIFFIKNQTMPN